MLKFTLSLALCLLARLIPHTPNMTPILALGLPFAKNGKAASFAFCALSILVFDLITAPAYFDLLETAVKMSCYGLTGLWAGWLLKRHANSRTYWQSLLMYSGIGIAGILFFDTATLILMAVRHPETATLALAGQIEFTGYHLMSILFMPLAPLAERWIVENKKLSMSFA